MAALLLQLKSGSSTINLLSSTGIEVKEQGFAALEVPGKNEEITLTLDVKGTTAAAMWDNYNDLTRWLTEAQRRAELHLAPHHYIEYRPDGCTYKSVKAINRWSLKTSPFEASVFTKDRGANTTLRNLQIALTTEPYWRSLDLNGSYKPYKLRNLVENSDFSLDTVVTFANGVAPTNWTAIGAAAANVRKIVNGPGKWGRVHFSYEPAAAGLQDDGISQSMTVDTAARSYYFSVWVKSTSPLAKYIIDNGAGGNVASAGDAGSGSWAELTTLYSKGAGQTTIRIRLVAGSGGAGIITFANVFLQHYDDALQAVDTSNVIKGYISGFTFDNIDGRANNSTTVGYYGQLIIANVPGDVPPLMRLGIENYTGNVYVVAWIASRRRSIEGYPDDVDTLPPETVGDWPLPFLLEGKLVSGSSTQVSSTTADRNEDYVNYPTTTASYVQIVDFSTLFASVTSPSVSRRPLKYLVIARMYISTANPIDVRLENVDGDIYCERKGITMAIAEMRWAYLGYMTFPPEAVANQGSGVDTYPLRMSVRYSSGGSANNVRVDCLILLPMENRLAVVQAEVTPTAPRRWTAADRQFLILENISTPGRVRVGTILHATTDGTNPDLQGADTGDRFRFWGDFPEVDPQAENELFINVAGAGSVAVINEQFRVHLEYFPRYLTPRGG